MKTHVIRMEIDTDDNMSRAETMHVVQAALRNIVARVDIIPKRSPFAATQAVRETACFRCQRLPGEPCQTPKGTKRETPHLERVRRYRDILGLVEFTRRHSVPLSLLKPGKKEKA